MEQGDAATDLHGRSKLTQELLHRYGNAYPKWRYVPSQSLLVRRSEMIFILRISRIYVHAVFCRRTAIGVLVPELGNG